MPSQDLTDQFIDFYQNFYREEVGALAQNYPDDQRSLYLSYDDLYRFDPDLAEDFRAKPDAMREYAEEALRLYDLPADVSLYGAHVRVTDLPENIGISDIRVHDDHVGELISFRGVVRKATDVRPKITEAAFECQRCGTLTYIPQSDRDYQEPEVCQGCEQRGPFRLNVDQSEMIDSQKLRVQEPPKGDGTGETPQSIEIDLIDDLCGDVTAGDHVTVVGMLRAEQMDGGNKNLVDLYVDGLSITPSDEFDLQLRGDEEQQIRELIDNGEIFTALQDSLAPSIYGLETEKLAILLQLFSGVQKETEEGETIRGNPHILLVSDPGIGLSRILRSAARVSPRSTYSNGAETSRAGVTAAAARTGGQDGPWELKAGALPIADRGLAVIDNLDDLDDDVMGALTEPMEQQQITISKASIHESVDTRVGVLAAGSPKYGRFDQYEPIGDQLDVDNHSLTLFDLVFTVTDNPNPEIDEHTADHVLDINQVGELREAGEDPDPAESVDAPVDSQTIQKHIATARRLHPVLTDEAKDHITEFYVDLRSKGADEDAPVPVTARKLEALVRLSEASARIRLSETVEGEDAERATRIVESCLKDIGVDPDTGQFDADVVETDTSEVQEHSPQNLKELIAEIENDHRQGAPIDEIYAHATHIGLDQGQVDSELQKLRTKGEVYEPVEDHLRTT
ncbi:DNA replication helicase protein MCM @ intein-containing [Halorubrum sp. DM2]|uniref:minichromosome maintenance protein MCM n=1 Tax=Halorubrum sp. DM2 TaxID=2527867 RepID=UPI0024B636C3|nr:minichromosome maintenance protein MCM [Halorubrum sp. DM2]VTT86183.1 DNA replication helicase protein MCM @ intein-containing [Halorubrum sp. DM2]